MRRSALPHLLSLLQPALTGAFVFTGPHPPWVALATLLAPLAVVAVDLLSGPVRNERSAGGAEWPFDVLVLAHAAIQFFILVGYLRLAAHVGFGSADLWIGALLVGHNTGWSAIVVGHELIHRPNRWLRSLGRALLCTALYEHFFTEHLRGHHVRVGTAGDPATARFGETLGIFRMRTIPAQFRSAWRLECRRLGDESMRLWDRRLLGSRVVHGLAVELALLVLVAASLGTAAVVALVLQALFAVDQLETVNYLEHWGLSRNGRRVTALDSWDSDSAFTRYALIGLARHADHHAHPVRSYQALESAAESPKLPYGYPPMLLLAHVWNARFRRLMTEELRRRRLGPFAVAR